MYDSSTDQEQKRQHSPSSCLSERLLRSSPKHLLLRCNTHLASHLGILCIVSPPPCALSSPLPHKLTQIASQTPNIHSKSTQISNSETSRFFTPLHLLSKGTSMHYISFRKEIYFTFLRKFPEFTILKSLKFSKFL